jgi:integrase
MNAYVYKKTRKKGVAWYVRLVDTDNTGQRVEEWLTNPDTGKPFKTKKEAEAHRIKVLNSVHTGSYVSSSNLTVEEWMTLYLDTVKVSLKPSTYSSYAKNVRNHIVPHIGHLPLQKLTAQHLNTLYRRLLEEGRLSTAHGTSKGLSPRTVKYVATIIGASLREAFNQSLVTKNVATQATPPKPQRNPERVWHWNENELATFLNAIEGHPQETLFRFYAFTGCRRGEALALTERSIDFEKGTVTLSATVNKIDGELVTGSNKSSRGFRTIAIDSELLRLLDRELEQRANEKRLLGSGYVDNNLVFAKIDGTHLYTERPTRVFRDLVDRLDVPRITLHGLRHTHASIMLAQGRSINFVAKRLGDDPTTVMKTYAHVLPTEEATAVEDFLSGVKTAHQQSDTVSQLQSKKAV